MAPLPRYEGTFSFVSSRLYASIKRAIPTYEKEDPKTWPYVTLSTIEKLRPYQGYPDLPTGVAYQREAMKRYENMYTPQERATAASVNGPLHQRYPYNYDRFDEPKEKVDTRREAARLRGSLFDKDSQLFSCQSDLKEYETTEKLRRRALEDAEYEVEKEKQRADAAEKECMLLMESNIRLHQRVRELEVKVKQAQDLDKYCVELETEIEKLNRVREGEKGGYVVLSGSEEDSDDCDDRPRKRMRSESL
ncbi:hypothetical protein J4E91_005343 [Alternaria rosae]|nr:hypothetical protein J4E91_005343 [Alternaria rosae]